MRRIVVLAGLALALGPLAARAQTGAGLNDHDVQFVYDAALGNVSEVVMGRLAAALATSEEVRAFGTMMVTDHTQAQADLLAIAGVAGVTLPPELAQVPPQAEIPPADDDVGFDATYVSGQILAHRRTIALFQREACRGGNAELQSFALQTLPQLQQHLAAAIELLPLAVAIEQDDPRGLDCPIDDTILPPGASPTPGPGVTPTPGTTSSPGATRTPGATSTPAATSTPTASRTPGPGTTPSPAASPSPTAPSFPPTPSPGASATPGPGQSPGNGLIFPRSNIDHPRLTILQ